MRGSLVTQLLYLCVLKKSVCVHVYMLCACAMVCVEVRGHFRNMFLPSALLRQGLFSCSSSCCCSFSVCAAATESLGDSSVPVSHLAIGETELWVPLHLAF